MMNKTLPTLITLLVLSTARHTHKGINTDGRKSDALLRLINPISSLLLTRVLLLFAMISLLLNGTSYAQDCSTYTAWSTQDTPPTNQTVSSPDVRWLDAAYFAGGTIGGGNELYTANYGSTTAKLDDINSRCPPGETPCFKQWVSVGTCTVLPIELLSFSAEERIDDVILTWVTVTETNNDYFVIERSHNTTDWFVVGTVNGAGNSTDQLTYTLPDSRPLPGTSYYRLKQVDFDGAFSYSDIEAVNFGRGGSSIQVFPNVSNSQVNYVVESSKSGRLTLQVYDILGRELKRETYEVTEGTNFFSNIIDAAPGKYIISILKDDGTFYKDALIIVE